MSRKALHRSLFYDVIYSALSWHVFCQIANDLRMVQFIRNVLNTLVRIPFGGMFAIELYFLVNPHFAPFVL